MDVETRALVRRRVSDERRRLTGAELDAHGITGMQTVKSNALAVVAWQACDGDALLALVYALDFLKAKREAPSEAA